MYILQLGKVLLCISNAKSASFKHAGDWRSLQLGKKPTWSVLLLNCPLKNLLTVRSHVCCVPLTHLLPVLVHLFTSLPLVRLRLGGLFQKHSQGGNSFVSDDLGIPFLSFALSFLALFLWPGGVPCIWWILKSHQMFVKFRQLLNVNRECKSPCTFRHLGVNIWMKCVESMWIKYIMWLLCRKCSNEMSEMHDLC